MAPYLKEIVQMGRKGQWGSLLEKKHDEEGASAQEKNEPKRSNSLISDSSSKKPETSYSSLGLLSGLKNK